MTFKVTVGKNGHTYYFYKGKRISSKAAKELMKKIKSRRKSSKDKKTGKCDGVICSGDKICNPASGRCVKKTGKIGKSLRKSKKATDKCDGVICSGDKICNPASGRCVKKTGKIGKKLISDKASKKTSKSKKKSRKTSKSRKKSRKGGNCEGVKCPPGRDCLEATGTCVKPCLPHQVRDPKTNRCRNKPGYKRERAGTGKYKPCPPHQERDPVTHRCKNKPGFKRERHKKTKPRPDYEDKPRWKDPKKDKRDCVTRSKLPLKDHQQKVVRYMRDNHGLLVVHGTGTGKTLTAVTISQCYLDDNPSNKVVFVGPAALEANFRKELRKYGVKMLDIAKYYKFYSFEKFLYETKRRNLNQVKKDKDRGKKDWPFNPISLKNKLLIVDEAHNARNPMTATARALEASSFTADKVLLLTATPFVNNMRDYIPLINMLYGRYVVGTSKEFKNGAVPDYLSKKPEPSEDDLLTFKSLLQDRVDVVNKKDEKDFPKRRDHMKYVKMTPAYLKAFTKLMASEKVSGLFFKEPKRFYNGYRRAVNMAGPEYFSSKVKKAVPYLKKGKALIYSNWLEFGVNPISQALKKAGISFKAFTGKTSKREREWVINDFNNGKFQVLIVSSAGGEGLDLKGVRSVVVLDPPWNDASLQQVIGRTIRYKSHAHLPKKDRVVDVYLMALVDPDVDIRQELEDEDVPDKVVTTSGDLLLYDIIKRKGKTETILNKALQKMSITR